METVINEIENPDTLLVNEYNPYSNLMLQFSGADTLFLEKLFDDQRKNDIKFLKKYYTAQFEMSIKSFELRNQYLLNKVAFPESGHWLNQENALEIVNRMIGDRTRLLNEAKQSKKIDGNTVIKLESELLILFKERNDCYDDDKLEDIIKKTHTTYAPYLFLKHKINES